MSDDDEPIHAERYEALPRRRRDEDLSLNEWRLAAVEQGVDDLRRDFRREIDGMVSDKDFQDLKKEVRALSSAVGRLPLWFIGSALTIVTVLIALWSPKP